MSAYRKDLRCPPKTHQSVMTMLEATKESMLPTSVGIATAGSQTPVSRTSRALRIIFKTKRNECQSGLLCKKRAEVAIATKEQARSGSESESKRDRKKEKG